MQLHTAREVGETLLRLAQRAQDPALAVIAHPNLGLTWFLLSAFPTARQHFEAGLALYTPDQHRAPVFRSGQDPGVSCRAYAAMTLWLLGYPEQALVHIHAALALAHACRIRIVWRLPMVHPPGLPLQKKLGRQSRLSGRRAVVGVFCA